MRHHSTAAPSLTRRTVLGALSTAAVAGLSGPAAGSQAPTYTLTQGSRCLSLVPLSGDLRVERLYDWNIKESDYSSAGTVHLQRPATSIVFLYDGPEGLSLVLVHGQFGGDSPGGSVTVRFEGLPLNAQWVVQDDFYDDPTNFDLWSRDGSSAQVDWTWAGGRTDGGAFRGLGGDTGLELTMTPAFNEEAVLYEQYYTGEVTSWQALSGSLDNPERFELRLDQPVTIRQGGCGDGSTALPPEDDDGGRPGEREGHEKARGEGHEKARGEGHDHGEEADDGHPSEGGQARSEGAKGKKKGKKKAKRRNKASRNDDDYDDDDVDEYDEDEYDEDEYDEDDDEEEAYDEDEDEDEDDD